MDFLFIRTRLNKRTGLLDDFGQILPESGYLMKNAGENDYIPAVNIRFSSEHLPVTGTSARSDIHPAGCH